MDIFVEEFSRNGRLRNRIRISCHQALIGRGYNNDVILSDSYVCPNHLQLEFDDDNKYWNLIDLSSVNGSFVLGEGPLTKAHKVRSGDEVYIGHTYLRLVLASQEVPPTRRLPKGKILADYFSMPVVALMLLIFTVGVFSLDEYLQQSSEPKWQELLLEGILYISIPCFWASFWALIGRVLVHAGHFAFHFSVGCLLVLSGYFLSVIADYISFGLNASVLSEWLPAIGEYAAFTGLLVATLWVATNMSRYRRWLFAHLLALGLVGFSVLYGVVQFDPYTDESTYHYTLKIPAAKLNRSMEIDPFTEGLDEVMDELTEQVKDYN